MVVQESNKHGFPHAAGSFTTSNNKKEGEGARAAKKTATKSPSNEGTYERNLPFPVTNGDKCF